MQRTRYMTGILNASFSLTSRLVATGKIPFIDCWPTAIGELLEKAIEQGQSEAEVIMQSIGQPPYSKLDYLKAGKLIIDSEIPEQEIIGYKVLEDCTLEYTNFEADEEIIIIDHCEDTNWKGTDFYDKHPSIFKPIFKKSADEFGAIKKAIDNITAEYKDSSQ